MYMFIHTHSPEELDFPSTMTNLHTGTWIMSGTGVMHNGDTIKENYGRSLDTMKVCVCLSVCLSVSSVCSVMLEALVH